MVQAAIVFRNRLLSLLGDQLLQELPPELAGPRSGCPPTTSETVTANGVRVSACRYDSTSTAETMCCCLK